MTKRDEFGKFWKTEMMPALSRAENAKARYEATRKEVQELLKGKGARLLEEWAEEDRREGHA